MSGPKAKAKVKFGAPPQEPKRYDWTSIARQLRERPGEWALVLTNIPASVPWSVNNGNIKAVTKARGFRTRTAGNVRHDDGKRTTGELWMVYDPAVDTTIKKDGVRG